jgi:Holliday junction resolvase RusA-like endonuclease
MPTDGERLRVTIPGDPGKASANKRLVPTTRNGKPAIVARASRKGWSATAITCIRAAARGQAFGPGPLRVSMEIFVPRQHRAGAAAGLGFLDVDAPIKATLDALQRAGAIVDDAQIVEISARKHHDAPAPRIEIEVWRA